MPAAPYMNHVAEAYGVVAPISFLVFFLATCFAKRLGAVDEELKIRLDRLESMVTRVLVGLSDAAELQKSTSGNHKLEILMSRLVDETKKQNLNQQLTRQVRQVGCQTKLPTGPNACGKITQRLHSHLQLFAPENLVSKTTATSGFPASWISTNEDLADRVSFCETVSTQSVRPPSTLQVATSLRTSSSHGSPDHTRSTQLTVEEALKVLDGSGNVHSFALLQNVVLREHNAYVRVKHEHIFF